MNIVVPDSKYARAIINTQGNPLAKESCIKHGLERTGSSCGCTFYTYFTKENFTKISLTSPIVWVCPKTGLPGKFDNGYMWICHKIKTKF